MKSVRRESRSPALLSVLCVLWLYLAAVAPGVHAGFSLGPLRRLLQVAPPTVASRCASGQLNDGTVTLVYSTDIVPPAHAHFLCAPGQRLANIVTANWTKALSVRRACDDANKGAWIQSWNGDSYGQPAMELRGGAEWNMGAVVLPYSPTNPSLCVGPAVCTAPPSLGTNQADGSGTCAAVNKENHALPSGQNCTRQCAAGYSTATTNGIVTYNCSAGAFGTADQECVPCVAGQFSEAGGECQPCPSGHFSEAGASVCDVCIAGGGAPCGPLTCG
jgi:hypothetical protein